LVVDLGERTDRLKHLIKDLGSELRVGHLAAAELERDLDLVSVLEERGQMPNLRVEVTLADLWPELDFLHRDLCGPAPRLLGLLGLLVTELAVIHDSTDRRVRTRGHLNEVKVEASSHAKCLGDRLDPQLISFRPYESNLAGPDSIIDPVLIALRRCYDVSLLCKGSGLPLFSLPDEARRDGRPWAAAETVTTRTHLGWPGGGMTPLRSIVVASVSAGDAGTITAMSTESDDPTAQAAAALEEARSRLASVPAETVVTNHAIGLYELAAIHLSSDNPDLTSASLAIDALAAVVESLGPRIGDDHTTLVDALANIRMAYVSVSRERLGGEPG
jgi:hypothetical protein